MKKYIKKEKSKRIPIQKMAKIQEKMVKKEKKQNEL